MKRRVLILVTIILLIGGCSSKELYTLGDNLGDIRELKSSSEYIAIDRVKVPIYLINSPIYIKDTPYHLKRVKDRNWINDIDKQLTQTLINYLHKSLNNSNIYLYPWSNIKRFDKRVSVKITKFIAYRDEVNLEATYQIYNSINKKSLNYFFNTKEKIKAKSINEMIKSMDIVYLKLMQDISYKL